MKIKLHNFKFLMVLGAFVGTMSMVQAQTSLSAVQKLQDQQKITNVKISKERGTPSLIKLSNSQTHRVEPQEASLFLREALGLRETTTLAEKRAHVTPSGSKVVKYQEYFKGVKVEHGIYNALSKDNALKAITLEHYELKDNFNVAASLSEDNALNYALNFVGATEYAWDYYNFLKLNETDPARLTQLDAAVNSVYPTGELVIVDNYNEPGISLRLAYKFNIYAAEPLYRADIYVDAVNGEILLADQDIKHAAELNNEIAERRKMSSYAMVQAMGETRYAGTRNFETTLLSADASDPVNPLPERYVLDGTITVNAFNPDSQTIESVTVLNETRSYDGIGGVPLNVGGTIPSYEITDGSSRLEEGQLNVEIADNFWSADEHYRDRFETPADNYPVDNEFDNDDVALDAHWGSEVVIRYWADRHNRWSFDGAGEKITSFVHYGDGYDNAFYSSSTMTYGDGSYQGGTNPNGSFAPLMSMDVAAHEIGHGVCDFTADLVYARQSGGMNEGFSDIWAAAVEAYVLEEIDSTLPYQPYGIGEQIDERDGGIQPGEDNPDMRALRFMDDPNAAGDPECFEGVNWIDTSEAGCPAPNLGNDQCGVHSNSGVLNKWFYLLVEGSGQVFTPGRDKRAADDEVNDNGDPYSVEGLGFQIAEQIAFKGEVLLTPNATFSDMRDASILVAQQDYGVDSNEEIQTTNAWFGICVGESYITPDPNQVFFSSANANSLQEKNNDTGCNTFRTYTVNVATVQVNPAVTVTLDTSASTAELGVDFDISTTTLDLEGTATESFEVTIYNDALVEEDELISILFDFMGETKTQVINVLDDDVVPAIGASVVEIMPIEEFASSAIPNDWEEIIVVDPSMNKWYYNGAGTESGRAYISYTSPVGSTNSAIYESNSPSHVILKTPELNALGLNDVRVTFDWEAGGELDPGNPAFDYGQLVYSFDGVNFEEGSERFALEEDGIMSGTFDEIIPELANTRFFLGFRWFNDTNATTSAFSFAIDNVHVEALPAAVETELNATTSNTVNTNNDVYFASNDSGSIIARIEGATQDLGCVEMTLTGSGTDLITNANAGVDRSSKVIEITADGFDASSATYDLTLFMTTDELANFNSMADLQIMKVEGSDIDATTSSNTVITGSMLEDLTAAEGYATFKGTFTGFSSFAIVQPVTASVKDVLISSVSLYPSPVAQGGLVNITAKDIVINSASVFDVRGAKVIEKKFAGNQQIQLSVATLQSGFYFVRLNNDANKTFKFIVK
ncbi:M4 family metallopeptidase [Croceibacter atlanticus]|jgi:Zn-dependent metalloprotease|uniref:Thermolysin n=1 Tax=Croceibacter atlanticus (strain ATCC BAA-628 / JCM 21780 / CIP 108009 / IAM 15332 / KCTC 12090 / HTCC2559) TaxID=216432 RepID=A3U8N5_CROAH|nr:M4 family metallopeptidase [Croceibacter atlanticus]EAP88602.1 thermolysin [Croceibacter atlanticus HTCC2559]MBW4969268.1 M4 family metallopeptidase [Croceibacter atlanticus]